MGERSACGLAAAVLPPLHPAVRVAWVLCALGAAMATFAPGLLALSLAFSLATSLVLAGAAATGRALAAAVPLFLVVAVANPLLSPVGATPLLRVGPWSVSLEGVAWGLAAGALVAAAVLWLQASSALVAPDDVVALLGAVLPTVALTVSLVLRLVPELLARARASRSSQGACTCAGTAPTASAFGREVERAGSLVAWALGESVERAGSMAARGWGAGQRTRWGRGRWGTGDTVACAVLACAAVPALGCTLWLGSVAGLGSGLATGGLGPWYAYLPVALLFSLPCLVTALSALVDRGGSRGR